MSVKPSSPAPDSPPPARRELLRDRVTLVVVRGLLSLPYAARVRLAGWIGRVVLGRFSRIKPRILAALGHFLPDLPPAEAQRIAASVPANFARMTVEILSSRDLAAQAATLPLDGPGVAALNAAHAQGRAAILVSGHFGNYDAWRLALIARGFNVGGYFKELGSPALNAQYVQAVSASGAPMFPDSGQGRRALVRFLRGGGMLGILADLDRREGVLVDFLGKPTRTVLSMAEMALKYDALLVPIYAIRTPNAPGFRIWVDAPVPHSDSRRMTQALNDSFGAQVRAHPDQWVWWHNRRKGDHPQV